MANLYKGYIRLLKNWQVDETKTQDLGLFIREQIKISFAKGENSKIEDKQKCQRTLESLEKLADNYYGKKYPYLNTITSTGLTPEQCKLVLSKEVQALLEEKRIGYFSKVKKGIKSYFVKESDSLKENKNQIH